MRLAPPLPNWPLNRERDAILAERQSLDQARRAPYIARGLVRAQRREHKPYSVLREVLTEDERRQARCTLPCNTQRPMAHIDVTMVDCLNSPDPTISRVVSRAILVLPLRHAWTVGTRRDLELLRIITIERGLVRLRKRRRQPSSAGCGPTPPQSRASSAQGSTGSGPYLPPPAGSPQCDGNRGSTCARSGPTHLSCV